MGARGRARVLEMFTPARMVSETEQIYFRLQQGLSGVCALWHYLFAAILQDWLDVPSWVFEVTEEVGADTETIYSMLVGGWM